MKKILACLLAITLATGTFMSLAADNEYTDKASWEVTGESYQNSVKNIIDGDINTYWHSYYEAENGVITARHEAPYRITVKFPDVRDISGFCYTPRQDMQLGRIHGYTMYLAENETDTPVAVHTGYIAIGYKTEYVANFEKTYRAKVAVLEIFASEGKYGTAAELGFLKGKNGVKPDGEPIKEFTVNGVDLKKNFDGVDLAGVKVSVSSVVVDNFYKAENTIDGDKSTYWHSYVRKAGDTIGLPPFTMEYTFPASTAISGVVYVPRQDMNVGRATKYNIYASSSDSSDYVLIYKGAATDDASDKVAEFSKNIEVKRVKYEIVESSASYGTCAEMIFVKPKDGVDTVSPENYAGAADLGEPEKATDEGANKAKWVIAGSGADDSLKKLIDGDRNSYWHSAYTAEGSTIVSRDEAPFRLTFTFPVTREISAIVYSPRQDLATGRWEEYNIYAAENDDKTPVLIKSGTINAEDKNDAFIDLGKTFLAKKIVIEITGSNGGFATAGEVDFRQGQDGVVPEGSAMASLSAGSENTYFGNVKVVPQKNWTAVASNAKEGQQLDRALDGNKKSYWHSDYTNEGSTITSKVEPPHDMLFTAKEAVALSGFVMTPRQDSVGGRPTLYDVYVSGDDTGEFYHIGEYTGDKTERDMYVAFHANVITKRLKVVIKETPAGYGMMAEVNFFAADENLKTVEASAYEGIRIHEIENAVIEDAAGEQIKKLNDGIYTTNWTGKKGDTIKITLPTETEIAAISVFPLRHYAFSGLWEDFDIAVSTDGENYDLALSGGKMEKALREQIIYLPAPAKAKYVEITVYTGIGDGISASEISVYRSKEGQESFIKSESEKYVLTIGKNEILAEKAGEAYTVTSDVAPFIKSDITFIPLRVLLEQMGATITWDGEKQEIGITKEDGKGKITITMRIWDDRVYVSDGDPAKYDKVRYTLIAPPRIYDGRTFIPLRFVSENLGYKVEWNGETREITITK
ncbi:MAG: discoidin domain-containing protein [Clostridia bacterium]|nr:discoidin domain-containing protein [Clostridia bacterium]